MRNNNATRKSRAASHLAGDKCSPGCGHMRLQLSDTLESLGAGISNEMQPYWLSGQIFHEKKSLPKNKKFRHVTPKNNNKVVSPDNCIFQDRKFCTCTQNMLPAGISKLSFL